MPFSGRPPSRLPRSALVVGLLLLTLVLAGVLAYQAQDAAHSHRAAAESALRDYAAFAGEEYAARLGRMLDEGMVHKTLTAPFSTADTVTETPAEMLERTREKAGHTKVRVESFFALDLASRELWARGSRIPASVRRWTHDSLAHRVRTVFVPEWAHESLLVGEGKEARLLTYTVKHHGSRPVAYGFTVRPEELQPFFRHAFGGEPLVPRSLARGLPNDSLLSVRVYAGGRELFRTGSRPADPALSAANTLPESFTTLSVRASLHPETAEMLLIGGLPRSRLPVLLGLLLLTTALVVAAIFQLRREYELARLRSEFVSSVSHELRTPLAQIRMFGETLLLGRVRSEAERRRSLEIIDQEARRLSHLVDNVLRFSRAERLKGRVDLCEVEVGPLVRGVAEAFSPLAATAAVHVEAQVEDGVTVRADPEALRQVLLNLLDNAVKYGPRGQTVTVAAESHDGWLRLRVDDQGPGIPPRAREKVWEAFWRLERESAAAVAGTGIGLAVVREIVSLHGGRTRVEEAPGGGARFVVELPGASRAARPALVTASGEEVA